MAGNHNMKTEEITVGFAFRAREQDYECVGFQDYTTRFGQQIALVVLRTRCPDCDAVFECMATKTKVRRRSINRRCPEHSRRDAASVAAFRSKLAPWNTA